MTRQMRVLAIPGVIDLQSRMGCVAQWWPLLAAMHELGHAITLVPYLGESIESPWWKTYPNPCAMESRLVNWVLNKTGARNVQNSNVQFMVDHYVKPRWEKTIRNIIPREQIDVLLFLTLPAKHFQGIPRLVRERFGVPSVYYDGDLPSSLPKYNTRSFKFGAYGETGASEFDMVICNSDGCTDDLKQLGARKVKPLHFAADPSVFSPVHRTHKYADIFYYGHRVAGKENRFRYMVVEPSKKLDYDFVVGGRENGTDLGRATERGVLSLSEWRTECCNSLINVNVTKDIHATVKSTSNARIFELAMLGCCVVSDEYNGIDAWFEPGKEIIVVRNTDEAVEAYSRLMQSEELRQTIGENARKRALSCHTFKQRASELEAILESL